MNTRQSGNEGEDFACAYIEEQGMKILARNYRFGKEEIDIIAKDGNAIVFIEVKAREGAAKGRAEEAVTPWKRRSIRKFKLGLNIINISVSPDIHCKLF